MGWTCMVIAPALPHAAHTLPTAHTLHTRHLTRCSHAASHLRAPGLPPSRTQAGATKRKKDRERCFGNKEKLQAELLQQQARHKLVMKRFEVSMQSLKVGPLLTQH